MKRSKSLLHALLLAALVALSDASLVAELVSKPIQMTVRSAQKQLLIQYSGSRYAVDLSNLSRAHELNEAKLIFANVIGAHRYLTVYVSGPSRQASAADKYCGAGTEGSLLWLMLDSRWRLLRSQAALVESCFESAEGAYEVNGARLTARWNNFHLNKSFTMSYDSAQPSAGMSVVEQSLDPRR